MIFLIYFSILLAGLCYSTVNSYRSEHPLENLATQSCLSAPKTVIGYPAFLPLKSSTSTSREEAHGFVLDNTELFQGDILLRNGTFDLDKFATAHKWLRWPDGVVPYTLDEIYSESEVELIRSAMDELEKHTCIKWIERTDEDDYVEIYSDMGCFSELGRVGGVQSLSLESEICMKKGIILHELMHAVGFLHEQTRFDRDSYIRVLWDNIAPGMEPNFSKMRPSEIDTLGLDYDYRSVMHYGAYMFAQDRSFPTLQPTNKHIPLKQLGYGQIEGVLTDLDIQKINKFYECT